MLIAEIALTFAAFLRGWKFWALLPLATGFVISILTGFGIVAANPEITKEDSSEFASYFLAIHVVVILTLIGMIIKRKQKAN